MKQPKFRGFSYETNSWQYGFGWFETDYTDDYLEEKGGTKQDAILLTDSGHTICDIESMGQYTGLKDKNGVDIYEGDTCTIWMGVKQDTPYVVEDLRELYLDMNHADSYYRISMIEVIEKNIKNPEHLEKAE